MAFGCPVSDIGPLPGRQIAPVARCRLQIALVFQVPWVLWLSPIVQHVIHSPAVGDHRCGGADVGLGEPGDPATTVGRVVGEERRHRLPALGVLGDELVRRCRRSRPAGAGCR